MLPIIGDLLLIALIIYLIAELAIPATSGGKKEYFWITRSIFKKKGEQIDNLEQQIADAEKAVETAKTELEKLSELADEESSEAKEKYDNIKKVYDDSTAKLDALKKSKKPKKKK